MDINTNIEKCPICGQTDKGYLESDVAFSYGVGFNNGPENYAMYRTKVCRGCGFTAQFTQASVKEKPATQEYGVEVRDC
jgi:hypothetical protein